MNLILDEISPRAINFCPPVRNTVMDDSEFMRVGYSTSGFAMNGIYTTITLRGTVTESFFTKSKLVFNYDNDNAREIDKIAALERSILKAANLHGKDPLHKLHEQLSSKSIRIFNNDPETALPLTGDTIEVVVKVSGVWITERAYGLTFKFFNINHP
jgi:hypothetical protein